MATRCETGRNAIHGRKVLSAQMLEVSDRSRNGAPSRQGCMVNGQITKVSDKREYAPLPTPPPPHPPPSRSPPHATQRAELNGRSLMNASAGDAETAKLLSNVMDARRQLEMAAGGVGGGEVVDVEGEGQGGAAASAAEVLRLEERLREAWEIVEVRNL